jgi:hypothetical protein
MMQPDVQERLNDIPSDTAIFDFGFFKRLNQKKFIHRNRKNAVGKKRFCKTSCSRQTGDAAFDGSPTSLPFTRRELMTAVAAGRSFSRKDPFTARRFVE